MEEVFIQSIKVNKARNLVDLNIPLSNNSKKHLIITGKNGSGKTSLLNEIKSYLNQIINKQIEHLSGVSHDLDIYQERIKLLEKDHGLNENNIFEAKKNLRKTQAWLSNFGGTELKFNKILLTSEYFIEGKYIIAFFEAKRNTTFKIPIGVNSVKIKPTYNISEFAGQDFIQYIVNLKADRSFAKDDNDLQTAERNR